MPAYIDVPITTDPDELTAEALDYLAANIPGWQVKEGHLVAWLIEVLARINAETRDVASRVPRSIFRYFGTTLFDLPPIASASASAPSTWTMRDNAGYDIPQGTVVAIRQAGDRLVFFTVRDAVTVLPGAVVTGPGEVILDAVEPGTAANALAAGAVELVDALSFVDSIVTTAATAGGVEAESDDAYLARLATELQLMSPRPILPPDFAILARRVAGVHRAVAIDNYQPPADEIQTVTVAGATGGNFTLTFGADTTAAIAHNADAATVQAALEALPSIGVGDVVCTGGPLNAEAVTVSFSGALAAQNVAQLGPTNNLTGGGTVVVTTEKDGRAEAFNQERMVSVASVDVAGEAIPEATKDAVSAYLESLREQNFVVWTFDPTYTDINVVTQVRTRAGYEKIATRDAVIAVIQSYLDPAKWAGGTETPPVWRDERTVRRLDLIAEIDRVPGVDFVETLTINGGVADVVLDGEAALPRAVPAPTVAAV